jgi:hypothetical protein
MARSIIGAGFDEYVKEQINLRQKNNAITTSKSNEIILYQNTNDAFLRLTSGVDVNHTNTDAFNFQLFSTRFGGFGSSGNFATGVGLGANSTYAYGFLSDGTYGYSPPPGLISADIKALNRGSLREATVQMVAHNSAQFEIIERLYLRLGYSMLLEWGHNMYFDNSKNFIRSNTHEVCSTFIKTNSYDTILTKIREQRAASDGNYDAMVGLVKNFSWDLKRDGSYDIRLDIISTGDIIESLKSNTSHPIKNSSTTEVPEDQPPLQFNAQKTTINKILWELSQKIPVVDMKEDGTHKFYLQGPETTASNIEAMTGLDANQYNNSDPSAQGDVVGFLFPQLNGVNTGKPGFNAQYFIKLGVFLRCLQNFCLLYNPDQNNESIFKFNWNENENFCFTYARHGSLDPRVCLIDIDRELKLNVNPVTGVATATPPTATAANYNINETQYEYKEIRIYHYNGSNYDEVYKGVLDFNKGVYTDPDEYQDLDSYINLDIITTIPAGQAFISNNFNQKFAIPYLAPLASQPAITKTPTTTLCANAANLNNVKVYTYSDIDLQYLNQWTGQTNKGQKISVPYIDRTLNDYIDGGSHPELYNDRIIITALENTEYIVEAGRHVKSEAVTSGGDAVDWNQIKQDLANGKITTNAKTVFVLDTYAIVTHQYVKASTGYTGTNVGVTETEDIDVSNQLFDKIRPGSKFRVDPDNYPFIGSTMNIYINMNYIAKILQDYVDVTSGAIAMYDLLDKLMKGVQNALGNINNFNITYDENTNEFSIVDSTFIPNLPKYLDTLKASGKIPENPFNNKLVEFITHTLTPTEGSFMRDASVKTKLSNNFQTMVTVGAQANKNVVGSNSTGLTRWNDGLTDRIITKKTSENNKDGTKPDEIVTNFLSNVGIVQNLYNAINDGNVSDQQIDGAKDAGIDLFNYEIGTYTNEGIIPGVGFIPIDLELTMEGLSGMKIYESYTADTKLLPPRYKDAIQFVITGISHKIQNNDWTTTIQSISGPRFDGNIGSPPKIKTKTINVIRDPRWKPSAPSTSSSTSINSGGTGGTPGVTRIRVVRSYADSNQVVSRLVLINVDSSGKETVLDDDKFWILENPWLNNQKAVTKTKQGSCVPLGFYNAYIEPANKRGRIIVVNGFSDGRGGSNPITASGITRSSILWHPGGNTKWNGVEKPWSTGCLLFATKDIINSKGSNGYFTQTAKSAPGGGYVSNTAREDFFTFLANNMNLKDNDEFDFEIVVAGTGNAKNYPKLNNHLPANDKYFG